MSAAPSPKPDDAPAPDAPGGTDADGWALLEGLRRRLDDHAAQGKKTQVQVTQLADSIAALVAAQRKREKRLNLNSFVAYLIFTCLCGAGAYLLYESRARELIAAHDHAVIERDAAVRRADEAQRALAAKEAEVKAFADKQAAPAADPDAAVKAAIATVKAGRGADAIAPLEAALPSATGADAAKIHYYLGVAYAKTGEVDKATPHLQAAVAANGGEEDARFQLASALDRSGAWAKARAEYDRFATAHPQSQLAAFAMRRSATLAHAPAVAPPGAIKAGATVTAPKPPAVAPKEAAPIAPPNGAAPLAPRSPAAAPKVPAPAPKEAAPSPASGEPMAPTASP